MREIVLVVTVKGAATHRLELIPLCVAMNYEAMMRFFHLPLQGRLAQHRTMVMQERHQITSKLQPIIQLFQPERSAQALLRAPIQHQVQNKILLQRKVEMLLFAPSVQTHAAASKQVDAAALCAHQDKLKLKDIATWDRVRCHSSSINSRIREPRSDTLKNKSSSVLSVK